MNRILIFTIISSIFLFGCTQSQTNQPSDTAHTGTMGIDFNFLTNYPPTTIYSSGGETGNSIVLEIKNRGAYTVGGVWFYLSGFDQSIIPLGTFQQATASIEGKSPTNAEGGYLQLQFPPGSTFSVNLPQGTDVYPVTLQATACYDYETMANLPVCIDPDPYGLVKQKACTPHGASTGGGQGAPVSVTSVVQESLPNKVVFKIQIGNVGGGQVISTGKSGVCTSSVLKYSDLDVVQYDVQLGSAGRGDCKPATPLRIVNGQGTINCIWNNLPPSSLAYTTALQVKLDYGYMSSKQLAIQIKKI